jgi:hypothetical protein
MNRSYSKLDTAILLTLCSHALFEANSHSPVSSRRDTDCLVQRWSLCGNPLCVSACRRERQLRGSDWAQTRGLSPWDVLKIDSTSALRFLVVAVVGNGEMT